jgi:hypothetical protein
MVLIRRPDGRLHSVTEFARDFVDIDEAKQAAIEKARSRAA